MFIFPDAFPSVAVAWVKMVIAFPHVIVFADNDRIRAWDFAIKSA